MPRDPAPRRRAQLTLELTVEEGVDAEVNRGLLESAVAEAVRGRAVGGALTIGLTVTTDEGIRRLNREHRHLDVPTDVLSFPLLEYEAPEKPLRSFPLAPGQRLHLGDIAISYPRAVEQSREYGHSLERELAFLAVHGTMHLLGYDHDEAADAARMRAEEEKVLDRLKLGREPD